MAEYAELIKMLRACADANCFDCEYFSKHCPYNGPMIVQAADAIETLSARLEQVPDKPMQWFSAQERPKRFGDYLVRFSLGRYNEFYKVAFYDGERWMFAGIAIDDYISHWMSIPEPQKEGMRHEDE